MGTGTGNTQREREETHAYLQRSHLRESGQDGSCWLVDPIKRAWGGETG